MELTAAQLLQFPVIAVLWTGYLALEGLDFGITMLLKILPKTSKERRVTLSSIGPHQDGNEVWALTVEGVTLVVLLE